MDEAIPFDRLGIPKAYRELVVPSAEPEDRLALAGGHLLDETRAMLGCGYLLAQDPSPEVRAAAVQTLRSLDETELAHVVGQNTPTKLLEYIAVLRSDAPLLDARIITIRNANDRTCILIAERAGPELCEKLCFSRERLLMTPRVFVALHGNRSCDDRWLEKASSFLRMNRILPDVPEQRDLGKFGSSVDLDAEIEAALAGEQSPALQHRTEDKLELFDLDTTGNDDDLFNGFDFEFTDDLSSFSWDLVDEAEGLLSDEENNKLENKIAKMTVGQKVRLAHVGNKTARGLLLRDRNKQVSMAVIKSGRLTDGEVKSVASNRNLEDDVLREVATNREWVRKYPVKVALVNNPKTPPSIGVRLVSTLQKRDLQDLSRNHNISSVIRETALRLFKQKYRSEGKKKKGRG